MSIQEKLVQAGFAQYVEVLVKPELTPERLAALSDADLQGMGVGVPEHRQALLALLKGAAPATPAQQRSLLPWILGGLVLFAVGVAGLVLVVGVLGVMGVREAVRQKEFADKLVRAINTDEDRRAQQDALERAVRGGSAPLPPQEPMDEPMDDVDEAALAKLVDGADSEDEMRRPIDALYEAWRTLDAAQYAAQWAPGGTRTDLKSGRTSTAEQVIRSRSALFPKLQYVDAQHTSRLLSFDDGVATFYTRYTMTITSNSGKTSSEVANESYRVKKINGRWLIIENRDYEP